MSSEMLASIFNTALDTLPLAFIRLGRDLRIHELKGKGLDRTDLQHNTAVGRHVSDLLSPEIVRRLEETLTGGPQSFQTEGSSADGHWRFSHFAFFHQDSEEIIGIAVDISDQLAAEQAERRSEIKYRTIFENASDAIFLFELNEDAMPSRIVEVNDVAVRRLGYSKEEFARLNPADLDAPEHKIDIPETMRQLCATGNEQLEFLHVAKDGTRVPVEVSSHLVTLDGQDYLLSISRDITERHQYEKQLRASLEEKEVLLKEIHHRVKNNLQIVSSMLSLEAGRTGGHNDQAERILQDTQSRVQAMALVHEVLYSVGSLAHVDLGEYIPKLFDHVKDIFMGGGGIRTRLDCDSIPVTIDQAVPIALLANEMLTNALKHAFPDGRQGEISLRVTRRDDCARLEVADTGVGLPEGISLTSDSIGMTLIRGLTSQLQATARLSGTEGTTVTVEIPLDEAGPSV